MSVLDTDKLQQIANASGDEYTDEAIAAARAELSSRPPQEVSATPGEEAIPSGWSITASLRALVALVLIWIGWVGVIGFVMVILSLKDFWLAIVFAAVTAACFLLARIVSPAWSRLIVVVPVAIGVLFLIRASLSIQTAESLFRGIVLLIGGGVAAVLRALRRSSIARATG